MNDEQRYATAVFPTPISTSDSLSTRAIAMLRQAAVIPVEERTFFREERNVWRPDSWLISRCQETLAQAGAAEAAIRVAHLATGRDPLAVAKTVYQVAAAVGDGSRIAQHIYQALARRERLLFAEVPVGSADIYVQELLLSAATYARLDNSIALFTYLERLDQIPDAWARILVVPEQRGLLAEVLASGGRHPLTTAAIATATRRYDDAGADLLQRTTALLDIEKNDDQQMIERCAATVRYASLTTMHSHRVAVAVLARAGHADEVMDHLKTIANIQEARRESGLALRRNEQQLLRQVKRPQANPDIDFQVYTLQEALRVMPLRRIPREQRAAMAKQLAVLGMKSDGWTAAGAATTLIELGALKLAVDVVDNIEPTDPTRGEGAIALVSGLLEIGEPELAAEQTEKALAWIRAFDSENAERATIWGLVEAYLDVRRPQEALKLLDRRVRPPRLLDRLRALFGERISDDDLRNGGLRLQAYLQQSRARSDVDPLFDRLRRWAPQLLDGDALTMFLVDGLLAPLLDAGYLDEAWSLLPDIQHALATSTGDRHAAQLRRISDVLTAEVFQLGEDARSRIERFLLDAWAADSEQGIWQAVHGIEGSLPLVIALSGPDALIDIAQLAAAEGEGWLPPSP